MLAYEVDAGLSEQAGQPRKCEREGVELTVTLGV
jgi:hypothetical protein